MRTAVLLVITQRVVVIPSCVSGPIGCPETSVRNYHYSLRNNPEERNSHSEFELKDFYSKNTKLTLWGTQEINFS